MKIIKRNGSEVVFDMNKIISAVTKANATVSTDVQLNSTQIVKTAEMVVEKCEELGHTPTDRKSVV